MKKQAGAKLRGREADVQYGNPCNLLDAANYIKNCRDSIHPTSIILRKPRLWFFMTIIKSKISKKIILIEFRSSWKCFNLIYLPKKLINFFILMMKSLQRSLKRFSVILMNFLNVSTKKIPQTIVVEENELNDVTADQGYDFKGFHSLYKKFVLFKEQISFENLTSIGAPEEYNSLLRDFTKVDAQMSLR